MTMELAMTTLTTHQLGLFQEPTKRKFKPRAETVPTIGTVIDINVDLVVSEDADGNPKTPMTKARFDPRLRKWVQLPVSQAGLMLFFNTAPTEKHTKARITTIIPSGRACYVEPE
jgi:hypothetical protein